VDQYMCRRSIITSRNLELSSPKETQLGGDSCTNCSMHRPRFYARTLRKDWGRGPGGGRSRESTVGEVFQGLDHFE
jgi:hypothetical protein